MQIITSLNLDFGFLKDFVQLKFEDRLKEESWKIVSVFHDRILEMKKYYEQTEDIIRKSFQQQLSDAIAVIKGMYMKFFEIEEEKAAMQEAAFMKMNALKRKLKDKEDKDFMDDLEQFEYTEFDKINALAKEPSSPKQLTEKELLECRMQNERLLQIIAELEEELQTNLKENAMLEDEIICLKEISDQDQRTIQKLIDSRDRLRYELDCEKIATQDMINRQKEEMDIRRKYASMTAKRGVKSAESVLKLPSRRFKSFTPSESSLSRGLSSASLSVSPKARKKLGKKHATAALEPISVAAAEAADTGGGALARPFSKVIADMLGKPMKDKQVKFALPQFVTPDVLMKLKMAQEDEKKALEYEVQKLQQALEDQKKKIERCKKETERINKNWERKFFILRNSFHVLKDEMFTRHTLFRQFAMISDTSFNYVRVKPLYVHSNMNETTLTTNVFHSAMMEHKFMDIPSDQETFTQSSKDSRYSDDSLDQNSADTLDENNYQ
ncbi:uncharacterized protein C10orf67 homolog, mitochondrial [Meriones unguiculatus]|uniref:uncharacterized protein C10orf67 homolog, mitochondrial n=1 Tax=Meriones unguiculatus TaxID=10047 RepID=UPI00293E5DF7|nr:uncharacterized protein C10orf67 homolog, mitochondrial [Meriones unguiculatus]